MSEQKFRHEVKHIINTPDSFILRNRLKYIAHLDPYAPIGGKYKVRSLYFDNPDDRVLMEKIEGYNHREKFRLRYYNNDTSLIKLEKKCKVNSLCTKMTAAINLEGCQKLISGDYSFFARSDNQLILELYLKMKQQLLRPKTVVDYLREAYMYPPGNVRITMDSYIKSGMFSTEFLNPELPTIGLSSVPFIVLEVKYDEFLPDIIRDILQINYRRSTALSKYAASRIYG